MLDEWGRPIPPKGGMRACVRCEKRFKSWDLVNNHRCRACLNWAAAEQVPEGMDERNGLYVDRPADYRRKERSKKWVWGLPGE